MAARFDLLSTSFAVCKMHPATGTNPRRHDKLLAQTV